MIKNRIYVVGTLCSQKPKFQRLLKNNWEKQKSKKLKILFKTSFNKMYLDFFIEINKKKLYKLKVLNFKFYYSLSNHKNSVYFIVKLN